jgi:hypothetical protein
MTLRAVFGWSIAITALVSIAGCSGSDGAQGGRCVAFDTCGGDVTGTWQVSNSCVEGNLTDAMNLYADIPQACRGDYKSVVASVSGTVSFNAGTATNETVTTIDYVFNPTAACVAAEEFATIGSTTCAGVAQALVDLGHHNTADCEAVADGCACNAQSRFERNEVVSYNVTGSTITYTGDSDTLDFCVAGSSLQARQFETDMVATIFFDATRIN